LAFANTSVDGFAFDVEVLRRLLTMGFGVVEYPVNWHYVHGTKVKLTTPLHMLGDIARIRLRRDAGTPAYIDTTYHAELASLVDPLFRGSSPHVGGPCRIAVPFDSGDHLEPLLVGLGLPATRAQSTDWADLLNN
jgi:hypothetical protein